MSSKFVEPGRVVDLISLWVFEEKIFSELIGESYVRADGCTRDMWLVLSCDAAAGLGVLLMWSDGVVQMRLFFIQRQWIGKNFAGCEADTDERGFRVPCNSSRQMIL